MKTFGILLFTIMIIGLSSAFADHRLVNTCLVSPSTYANPEYISALVVFDDETGLTSALHISTTFTEVRDCLESLRGNLDRPEASFPGDDFIVSSKCYTGIGSNAYYAVVEKRNPETGLVVELDIINEFDSYRHCKASL